MRSIFVVFCVALALASSKLIAATVDLSSPEKTIKAFFLALQDGDSGRLRKTFLNPECNSAFASIRMSLEELSERLSEKNLDELKISVKIEEKDDLLVAVHDLRPDLGYLLEVDKLILLQTRAINRDDAVWQIYPTRIGLSRDSEYERKVVAPVTKAKHDLRALASGLSLYRLDNFKFPSTDQGLAALVEYPNKEPWPNNWKQGGYLDHLPKDPWGRVYLYESNKALNEFRVYSLGADGKPGGYCLDADISSDRNEELGFPNL